MDIAIGTTMADYELFLKIRQLPSYQFTGRIASIPDADAARLNLTHKPLKQKKISLGDRLFDYQRDITSIALRKRKFAVFADCGLGKTLILLEFAKHVTEATRRKCLIVSPLMVINQTIAESHKFYSSINIGRIRAAELPQWLLDKNGPRVGVTNYESITDALPHNVGGIILDESSMLKSHYGAWGTRLIKMGQGVEWKLCATGTPAPNDRIEFANHAVFLDRFSTVNAFLATYFVNRGETQNRWEIKPHAIERFYHDMAAWAIFLTNPATYGWADNIDTLPPIHVHIEHVPMTREQQDSVQSVTGCVLGIRGGIGSRSAVSQIAKGAGGIPTMKHSFIANMISQWPDESTIVWCRYNHEQDMMEKALPTAGTMRGETPENQRQELIENFQSGVVKQIITKPKILGFGLNLQIATRQVFSGLEDSYEEFYQCVKRSNRVGSTKPLHVHIPVTDIEMTFVDNVLGKSKRVESDAREQEKLFQKYVEV